MYAGYAEGGAIAVHAPSGGVFLARDSAHHFRACFVNVPIHVPDHLLEHDLRVLRLVDRVVRVGQ